MVTIATGEPSMLTRGDSARWYISDTDYPPADGWTMKYYLVNKDVKRVTWASITNNGDGNYLVTLATSDTNALVAGLWNWQRVATKVTEQITRDSGSLTVAEGFASVGAPASPFVDGRSVERQALDELNAVILDRIRKGLQVSASYNGRAVSWESATQMYDLKDRLEAKVRTEFDQKTTGRGRDIRVRLGVA